MSVPSEIQLWGSNDYGGDVALRYLRAWGVSVRGESVRSWKITSQGFGSKLYLAMNLCDDWSEVSEASGATRDPLDVPCSKHDPFHLQQRAYVGRQFEEYRESLSKRERIVVPAFPLHPPLSSVRVECSIDTHLE